MKRDRIGSMAQRNRAGLTRPAETICHEHGVKLDESGRCSACRDAAAALLDWAREVAR